jgi:hypothetical protein
MEVKYPIATVSSEPLGIYDARAIWYGPHNCSVCGDLVVKMASEQGGLTLDSPQEPIYPNHRWTTHQHSQNPTKMPTDDLTR